MRRSIWPRSPKSLSSSPKSPRLPKALRLSMPGPPGPAPVNSASASGSQVRTSARRSSNRARPPPNDSIDENDAMDTPVFSSKPNFMRRRSSPRSSRPCNPPHPPASVGIPIVSSRSTPNGPRATSKFAPTESTDENDAIDKPGMAFQAKSLPRSGKTPRESRASRSIVIVGMP
eukprot:scaffold459_cov117-Isochrysis_galbana.AAC.12